MKGMTNALPVLIDASTLATKSDISDMETKTNANATFATKTALTTLQNSVGDAFSQVAVGSDGKSLDFTALDGQVNNVVLPSSGGSNWESITTNPDFTKIKIGTQMIIGSMGVDSGNNLSTCSMICVSKSDTKATFTINGYVTVSQSEPRPSTIEYIAFNGYIENTNISFIKVTYLELGTSIVKSSTENLSVKFTNMTNCYIAY